MSPLTRIFGNRKAGAVDTARVDKVIAPVAEIPRPVRSMVYREARVTCESGYVRKGIVLDYSDRGVRVRFPTNEKLPGFVTLDARAVGIAGMAEVVWQKGMEAGLRLLG